MIIAQDAITVCPPYMFLVYMVVPAISTWIMTTLWIERCWILNRYSRQCSSEQSGHKMLLSQSFHSTSDTGSVIVVNSPKPIYSDRSPSLESCELDSSPHTQPLSPRSAVKKVLLSPFPYAM